MTRQPKPEANGQPAKPRRTRKPKPPDPPPDPPEYRPGNARLSMGRIASQVEQQAVQWFADPWIPRGQLSFVVGEASSGKSTFGAWLCSLAKRPAILPGFEEEVTSSLLPRLKANGVDLRRTLLLDDRPYLFPFDRPQILQALRAHDADLLWIDPIDSYVGDCNENDGPAVRAVLEAICKLARDASIPVVCARHPGKLTGNICPGSRQWRAVPRVILELLYYAGPPAKRLIRINKDPYGRALPPQTYDLLGEPGSPRKWSFGEVVADSEAECLAVPDRLERWKIDQAVSFLQEFLSERPQESAFVYAMGEKEKLHDRCLRRAAERLGVIVERSGSGREHKSTWRLPGVAPDTPDERQTDTPSPAESGSGV